LGYRYIWIDALCIDQRDTEEKADQIAHMGEIYRCADLTIVAACGDSVEAGLSGVDPEPRSSTQISETIAGKVWREKLCPLRSHLKMSAWSQRGWTFQEACLSRRYVVVTCERAFVICPSSVQNEGFEEQEIRKDWQYRVMYDRRPEKYFKSYTDIVSAYTVRGLAYASDSLNAIKGVLSL
jgi:hypothetical protein